jgi:Domain of unknown function (DUF4352)
MSQPPPQDQGQPSNQGEPPAWPSAGNEPPSWPAGNQPPSWPAGNQPSWPAGNQPSAGQPQSWPSPGQAQPSWPSGGTDQGQPPPWPPGGQPPYPGPGYAYGYDPRPPRPPRPPRFRRRRHPILGALIALGMFVLFGTVVRIATSHSAVSVAPFPSASGNLATARQAPPGKLGSSFDLQDGSGDTYRVTLVKVIDPARGAAQFDSPDVGKRFVGLVFRIKALTGSPQNEDANNDAMLFGGDGQEYSADFSDIAGYTNFDSGTIHVAQGDTVTGAVTFEVPNAVTVSKAQWGALSGFGSTVEWDLAG